MSSLVPISFGQGSNVGLTGQEGIAEFVNAYLESRGQTGKTPFVAYAIPGLVDFATLGSDADDGVRAMLDLDTTLLTVCGRLLYASSAAGGAATLVGGIPADGIVTMAANRASPNRQVIIVADGNYWIYQGGALSTGADADLPPPIAVVEKGGFFVFLIADGRVMFSEVNDDDVGALNLIEANANADGLLMGAIRGPDVIFAGPKSLEFWQLNGSTDPDAAPFSRAHSLDIGLYAAGAMQRVTVQIGDKLGDSIIWAATDHEGQYAGVFLLDGFTPVKISTPEIDRLVLGEANREVLRSEAWTENGHAFFALGGTDWTRVYDTTIGGREGWHRRVSHGRETWRCGPCAFFAGKTIFGDPQTNRLYFSRMDAYDEVGDPIQWLLVTPPVHMWPKAFKLPALHIDALTGIGINSEDEDLADPILFLDYTRDGGQSWAAQRQIRLGGEGQRWKRVKERAFGRFDGHGLSFRMSSYAAVTKGIQGMAVEIEPLR
jgi:hypothetical protein